MTTTKTLSNGCVSRTYKGWTISRNERSRFGMALRWRAWDGSQFVHADTLQGIRQLINGEA